MNFSMLNSYQNTKVLCTSLQILPIVKSTSAKKDSGQRKHYRRLKAKPAKEEALLNPTGKCITAHLKQYNSYSKKHGPPGFDRKILHLCKTKGEMSYLEAKEQFDRRVLLDDSYYNGIINCKIHRTHVKNLK